MRVVVRTAAEVGEGARQTSVKVQPIRLGTNVCSKFENQQPRFVDNQIQEEHRSLVPVDFQNQSNSLLEKFLNGFLVGHMTVKMETAVYFYCIISDHTSGVGCGGCERKQSLERANASHSGVGAIRHSNKQIQSRGNNPRQQVVDLSGSVLSERIVRFECNSLLLITRNRELGPPLRALPL